MANREARGKFQVMFIGEPDALRRSFAQVDRETVEFNRRADHMRGRLARFGIGLTAAATAVGIAARDVITAGEAAQVADRQLEAQFRALGLSYRRYAPQVDGVVQKLANLSGFKDVELERAYTTLIRGTGSVTQSLHLLELSTDLARGKHIDLERAAKIVTRVAGGNVGILRRYGIELDKNATSASALAVLSAKFQGQAETYGHTAKGAGDRYEVATEHLKEAVGEHLLPAITNMALTGIQVVNWTGRAIENVGRAVDAVADLVTAIAGSAVNQVRALPGRITDGARWIAGRILDGAQAPQKLLPDSIDWMLGQELAGVKTLFSPGLWTGLASGMITAIVKGLGDLLVHKLLDLIGGAEKILEYLGGQALGGQIVGGGAFGKDKLALWLTTALLITNHFSAANLHALYGRAMQESGGDPHEINLWDSNAKAGHPSKGLLQTIDSTFDRYKLPGHGDIWNPVDNAIAAIRYMFAVYGHIVGPSGSGYAAGGDFAINAPYRFLTGEHGRERVQIRPVQPRRLELRDVHIGSTLDAHQLAHRAVFLLA